MIKVLGARRSPSDSKRSLIGGRVGFSVLTGMLIALVGGCIRGHERDRSAPLPAETAAPAPVSGLPMATSDAWSKNPRNPEYGTLLRLQTSATKLGHIVHRHLELVGKGVDRPLRVSDEYWLAPGYRDTSPLLSANEVLSPAPTEMGRYLLPEGLLDPGGTAEGFIYFKPSRTPESVYVVVAPYIATDWQEVVVDAHVPRSRTPSS